MLFDVEIRNRDVKFSLCESCGCEFISVKRASKSLSQTEEQRRIYKQTKEQRRVIADEGQRRKVQFSVSSCLGV